MDSTMNVLSLTRTLVDIESITGNELRIGEFVFQLLSELAGKFGGAAERIEVAPDRCNVFACFGEPVVTLSTHRQAAFESAQFLMDYLKASAPFWKTEETGEGSHWVPARESVRRSRVAG